MLFFISDFVLYKHSFNISGLNDVAGELQTFVLFENLFQWTSATFICWSASIVKDPLENLLQLYFFFCWFCATFVLFYFDLFLWFKKKTLEHPLLFSLELVLNKAESVQSVSVYTDKGTTKMKWISGPQAGVPCCFVLFDWLTRPPPEKGDAYSPYLSRLLLT